MEGRERVRRHLGKGGADRPPLIVFGTHFAARLEQVEPGMLWRDVNLLTRTLIGLQSLFDLDAILLELPVEALRDERLATASDAVGRLRTIAGGGAALVVALPGPLTRARAGGDRLERTVEELGEELVDVARELSLARADCLAVVERTAVSSAEAVLLDDTLTPVWNAARYYAVASLLVAAEGVEELGDTGADALAVWAGASPDELAARGARHVGVPVEPGDPERKLELPELPHGGFYISRGDVPPETAIEAVHQLVAAAKS